MSPDDFSPTGPRRRRRLGSRLLGTLLSAGIALASTGPALAHESWMAPSTYRATSRDTITVRAYVGEGFRGDLRPYSTRRTLRFTTQGARRVDLTRQVTDGELRWALFMPDDDGGQMLAYESDFALIRLDAERFDAYLEAEGLDAPLAARRRRGAAAGDGRERYARCFKAWVAGSDARRATRPQGLPLEIVPLSDPSAAGPLRVRVLHEGRVLAHALVRAWNRPLRSGMVPTEAAARDSVGLALQVRTGADGTATLQMDRDGEWLVNVVHMFPSRTPRDADWQSLWSSLSFARSSSRR